MERPAGRRALHSGKGQSASIGTPEQPIEIAVTQWRTNLYGRVFLDQNGDSVSQASEPGLPLVPYNIRYRDGSYMGFNNTDLNGYAASTRSSLPELDGGRY